MPRGKAKSRKEENDHASKNAGSGLLRLVLLSFLFSLSSANLSAQIKPFEDYSKCVTGFLNEKGDTVFPAQFEMIKDIRLNNRSWYIQSDTSYWLVNYQGKFGYLNQAGVWLLKPQFEDYYIIGDKYFFFHKSSKYGVFDRHGKMVLPVEFDTIYSNPWTPPNNKVVYNVVKSGRLGLYSNDFKLIVPHEYDTIDQLAYRVGSSMKYHRMFMAKGKNKAQVYDSLGLPLVPNNYIQIEPFVDENTISTNYLFGVKNAKNLYTVVDSTGKELVKPAKFPFQPLFTPHNFIDKSRATYLKLYDGVRTGDTKIVRLSDGKETAWYSTIGTVGDWFVVFNAKKWKVLDSSLNVVFVQPDSSYKLHAFYAYSTFGPTAGRGPDPNHDTAMHEHYLSTFGEDVNLPQLFVLEKQGEQIGTWKHDGQSTPFYKKRVGLLHMTSKVQSPVKYDQIVRFGGGGKTYYWAVYPNEDTTDAAKKFLVDVYDTDVKLLRTIFLSMDDNARLYKYASNVRVRPNVNTYNATALPEFRDSTLQQIKWIDGTLPEVATFDFPIVDLVIRADSSGYALIKDPVSKKYSLESIQNGNHPFEGKTFMEIQFYRTGYNNQVLSPTVLIGDEIIFTDREYNVVLDSCSQIVSQKNMQILMLQTDASILAVRKGMLYGYIGNKFELMDSTRLKYGYKKYWFYNQGYVDKHGRFFTGKSPVIAGNYAGSVSDGVLTLEHLKTGEQINIKNISSVKEYNGEFKATSSKGKKGLISGLNGNWAVKLKYDSIVAMDYYTYSYYFARNNDENGGKWLIVNAKARKVTKAIFDVPFHFSPDDEEFVFARSNGKMGTLNNKFKWATKPLYDTCGTINHVPILYGENTFAIIDEWTGKSFSTSADSVFIGSLSHIIVLFDKGTIEVRQSDGDIVLPRTNIEEGLKNDEINLFSDPVISKSQREYRREHPELIRNIPAINRRMKYLELQELREWSFSKELLLFYKNRFSRTVRPQDCDIETAGFSPFVYSEKISGDCVENSPFVCNEYDRKVKYVNYRISNDSLILVEELADLFIPGSNWEMRMNELLTKAIQADQVFGLSCVDVPGTIEDLKPRFILSDEGISFKVCGHYDTYILISTETLKDVLRWPEMFN